MSGWGDLVEKLAVLISTGVLAMMTSIAVWRTLVPHLNSNKVPNICCMGKLSALNPMVHSKGARNELFMVIFYILVC